MNGQPLLTYKHYLNLIVTLISDVVLYGLVNNDSNEAATGGPDVLKISDKGISLIAVLSL